MKANIITIISLLILSCLFSCQQQIKARKCNHEKFIHEYVEENFESETFIADCDYIFFANIGIDSIMITDNISLYEIYKSQYIDRFSDFKIFLCSVYEDHLLFNKRDIDINIGKVNKLIFKKDTSIINLLSSQNINKLKTHYFTDRDYFRTNIDITQNEKYNILYFFFKNEYYISHSEYDGSFLITEMDSKATSSKFPA